MNIVETGVSIGCVATICCLGLAGAHGVGSGGGDPMLLLDQQHMRAVHQGMVAFGNQSVDKALPMPGRINRFTDARLGRYPNLGRQNWRKDSSGHLYSAMIALELVGVGVVVSPAEVNPIVSVYGSQAEDASTEYDFGAYDPASDVYWMGDSPDPQHISDGWPIQGGPNQVFRMKINRPPSYGRGHASYAHAMLAGERRFDWSVDAAADRVLLGNRGTKDGASSGDEFERSRMLLQHGDPSRWVGSVVRGDGRVERLEIAEGGTFQPIGAWASCGDREREIDNIFAADFDSCGDTIGAWRHRDAWLGVNDIMADGGEGSPKPLPLFDELRD